MGAVAEAVGCRRRDLQFGQEAIWPRTLARTCNTNGRCGDIVSVGMIGKHPGAKCFRTLETRSAQSDPAQVERELVGGAVGRSDIAFSA